MTAPTLAFSATPSTGGVRATIDALWNTRRALERAIGALGLARVQMVSEKIDAFCAAAQDVVQPAHALSAQAELIALKKSFDDQELAFHMWEQEINDRLARLAAESRVEVLEALDLQIAELKLEESKEQADVDGIKSVILELGNLRTELQGKGYPPAPAPAKKDPASKVDS